MILEDAAEMAGLATEIRGRQEIARLAEAWVTHQEALEEFQRRLQSASEFIAWARSRGIDVEDPDATAKKKAKQEMSNVLKQIGDDPAQVLSPGYMPRVRDTIRSFINGEEKRAQTAWQQLCDSIKWERADLWQPFATAPKYRASVEEAAAQDHKLDLLLRKPFLTTPAERVEFDDLLTAGRELRQTLPTIDSAEVQAFMSAVGVQGAPLALLTPTVVEWLTAHGLIDNYIVRRQHVGGR